MLEYAEVGLGQWYTRVVGEAVDAEKMDDRHVAADLMAVRIAQLTGLNCNTLNRFLACLRERVAEACDLALTMIIATGISRHFLVATYSEKIPSVTAWRASVNPALRNASRTRCGGTHFSMVSQ